MVKEKKWTSLEACLEGMTRVDKVNLHAVYSGQEQMFQEHFPADYQRYTDDFASRMRFETWLKKEIFLR